MTAKIAPSMRRNAKYYMHTTVLNVVKKLKIEMTTTFMIDQVDKMLLMEGFGVILLK